MFAMWQLTSCSPAKMEVGMQVQETLEAMLIKCRVCLSTCGVIDIFDSPHLAHKLQLCTDLPMNVRENLPRKICRSCNQLLHTAITLRNFARNSDTKLRMLQQLSRVNHDESKVTLECVPDIHIENPTTIEVGCTPDINVVDVDDEENCNKFPLTVGNNLNTPEKTSNKWTNEYRIDDNKKIICDMSQDMLPKRILEKNFDCNYLKNTNSNGGNVKKKPSFKHKKILQNEQFDLQPKINVESDVIDLHKYEITEKLQKYSCNLCDNKYKSKASLNRHLRVHAPKQKPC